ncbi:MAG: phosphate acyltransferase PlsX, partial [Longimicrobiales bacterium]|nr:phosphate acyltransferase PlsX [Longimicrobiales bacterium]
MRIALDAMGSDSAPFNEIEGAVAALRRFERDWKILLVGDQERLDAELSRHSGFPRDRISVVHAPDRIISGEAPAAAVRQQPGSSIVVGVKLQQEGKADAFVSAGSTGAVMAASLLFLRPLPGVDRPAIGTVLPTSNRPTLLLDAGANVDCRPQHLLQFAHLGTIYAKDLMGVENPRVGLLNIGEEPEKGNELAVESHKLLGASDLNFIGNIEGREIIRGGCDVLVCDGFDGNLILKFYESVAEFIIGLLRKEMAGHQADELHLDEIFRFLDYEEYGGAPLLGVNGVSIIMHGSSSSKAIAFPAPRRAWRSPAVEGSQRSGVAVARMRMSISPGSTPAFAMAVLAASAAISAAPSSARPILRSPIPVRSRIHSSEVSTIFSRSAFV